MCQRDDKGEIEDHIGNHGDNANFYRSPGILTSKKPGGQDLNQHKRQKPGRVCPQTLCRHHHIPVCHFTVTKQGGNQRFSKQGQRQRCRKTNQQYRPHSPVKRGSELVRGGCRMLPGETWQNNCGNRNAEDAQR